MQHKHKDKWGAGNSWSLVIGERAGSTATRRCDELLVTLRAHVVRNLSAEYPSRT